MRGSGINSSFSVHLVFILVLHFLFSFSGWGDYVWVLAGLVSCNESCCLFVLVAFMISSPVRFVRSFNVGMPEVLFFDCISWIRLLRLA